MPIARPGRLRQLAVVGGLLVLIGRIGTLLARALALGGNLASDLATVLQTSDTQRLVLVVIALGCVATSELPTRAVWLDVPVRRHHDLTCRQALGWLGVINLAVLAAWGGHSALDGSVEPGIAVAKAGHLMGLGLWVGVLAVLVAVDHGRPSLRPALSAMSRTAVTGAFLTVISGLVLTSRLIVSVTAWAATPYGQLLIVKIVLIGIAVVLGLAMRRSRRSRGTFGELALLLVVVLLGSAMATATPAIDPGFTDRTQAAPPVEPAVQIDDLLLQARAIPARPGVNTIEIRIGETRRPNPGPTVDVAIDVDGEHFVTIPDSAGVAYVEGVMLTAGETTMSATIHRTDWPDGSAVVIVSADPPVYVHPVVISSQRIWALMLVLAGALAVVGLFLIRHDRARRRSTSEPVDGDGGHPDVHPAGAEQQQVVKIS